MNESNHKAIELTGEIHRLSGLLKQGNHQQESNHQNLVQEIERLNNTLRVKVTESIEWQNKFAMIDSETSGMRQEYENIKVALLETGSEADHYKKRIQ